MSHYLYQTVAVTTDDDDPTTVTGMSAAGAFDYAVTTPRKPKLGAKPVAIKSEDVKPYRFTPEGATHIARYLVTDPAVLSRWASTPDASERLALLVATGIEPKLTTSSLSPTRTALAPMQSVGAEAFVDLLSTGGFVVASERGGKAAATSSAKRAATADEKRAAVLGDMFATADSAPAK